MSDHERIIAKLIDLILQMNEAGAGVPATPNLTPEDRQYISKCFDAYLAETGGAG